MDKAIYMNKLRINSLLIKVASKCNLNCKYCYMYNLKDNSYTNQPRLMSYETAHNVIRKVYKHCVENNISEFLFVFHGGEPLLQPKEFFIDFVSFAGRVFGTETKLYFAIQSNGSLLSNEIAELFDKLKIQIGISLDGDKSTNDVNRLYKNGRSSYNDVIIGLNNSLKFDYHKRSLGILTVINLDVDPKDTYDFFKGINVPRMDFLFPYYTWDSYPLIHRIKDNKFTPYADWLIKIFDLWYDDKEQHPDIRMFSGFIRSFLGEEYPDDQFGCYPNSLLVVEANGEIEPIDYLKACYEDITKTGLNINKNEISDANMIPLIVLYYNSHKAVCSICKCCPLLSICGGTVLPARYSDKNGFDNVSIYCKDIVKLLVHIQNKIIDSMFMPTGKDTILTRLNYKDIIDVISKSMVKKDIVLQSFKKN